VVLEGITQGKYYRGRMRGRGEYWKEKERNDEKSAALKKQNPNRRKGVGERVTQGTKLQ